jgi:pyruvate formate lyase activating enzyme
MFRAERCARECRDCLSVCPQRAITKRSSVISVDQTKCDLCGKCQEVCMYEAIECIGQKVGIQEILDEVIKDRIFYEESQGGVTFSGGEPLAQPDFLLALLTELNKRNIHTAVDTSGFVPFEILEKVSQKADLILFDLKIMDEEKHRRFTGESNALILENLKKLSMDQNDIIIRVPILEGINDEKKDILKLAEFLGSCGNIHAINLLPYHKGGEEKRRRLNQSYLFVDFRAPSEEKLQEIRDNLSAYGFSVRIGG